MQVSNTICPRRKCYYSRLKSRKAPRKVFVFVKFRGNCPFCNTPVRNNTVTHLRIDSSSSKCMCAYFWCILSKISCSEPNDAVRLRFRDVLGWWWWTMASCPPRTCSLQKGQVMFVSTSESTQHFKQAAAEPQWPSTMASDWQMSHLSLPDLMVQHCLSRIKWINSEKSIEIPFGTRRPVISVFCTDFVRRLGCNVSVLDWRTSHSLYLLSSVGSRVWIRVCTCGPMLLALSNNSNTRAWWFGGIWRSMVEMGLFIKWSKNIRGSWTCFDTSSVSSFILDRIKCSSMDVSINS